MDDGAFKEYQILPDRDGAGATRQEARPHDEGFGDFVLLENIRWFIRLRWVISWVLAGCWCLTLLGIPGKFGLQLGGHWLLVLALVLIAANLGYFAHYRHLGLARPHGIRVNLWTQIVLDLLAVTYVVHMLGSIGTFAAFLYLLHIVLACVFFLPRYSLLVMLVSSALYVGCVFMETAGILSPHLISGTIELAPFVRMLHALSAVLLWAATWYLASRLSATLRMRNLELIASQKKIRQTMALGQQHMKQTAHQMKSPLAAIQSNLILLGMELGDEMSKRTEELMARIDRRCSVLNEEVRDILNLANLKAGDTVTRDFVDIQLDGLLQECTTGLQSNADGRRIEICVDVEPFVCSGDRDAMKMLFDNLISNAINYSEDEGRVEVTCRASAETATIQIQDHGIGIPEDKLPRVFDDYYRTEDAKKHCIHSTGMGLAIVKYAAAIHGIGVSVASKKGEGTRFTLKVPSPPERH